MSTERDQLSDVLQILIEVSRHGTVDAKPLRVFEGENGKLKNLLVEQLLDNALRRDINSKIGDALLKAESCGA